MQRRMVQLTLILAQREEEREREEEEGDKMEDTQEKMIKTSALEEINI